MSVLDAIAGVEALPAGVFAPSDRHFAEVLARRGGVGDATFAVAAALAAKAVRLEHVCADFADEPLASLWGAEAGLEPPRGADLLAALVATPRLVEVLGDEDPVDARGGRPLVVTGTRCYLRRYAVLEQLVAGRLRPAAPLDAPDGTEAALAEVAGDADESQLAAVRRALTTPVSIVAGGPGAGKTTAIATLLAVARALPAPLSVALAAPTGKAAARLDEAVRAVLHDADGLPQARTLHRLLGIGRDGVARGRTLEADVVVVDEASMVSLPLLAETLRRTREDARVVLVGDPDQLASIEVGAVLADVVDAARDPSCGVVVAELTGTHRFGAASGVAALADAVRAADPVALDAVVASHDGLRRVHPSTGRAALLERVVDHAEARVAAARAGDAREALRLATSLGVLCAARRGDGSTAWWERAIEERLRARGVLRRRDVDYVGRPLLATRNDPLTGLANGMTGVVVAHDDGPRAVFEVATLPVAALGWVETAWALTIHKSQGSEYDEVVVSLPEPDSPLLTRELVYTAVTRSRGDVTLVAPDGSIEVALARRVARSSGLAQRLQGA